MNVFFEDFPIFYLNHSDVLQAPTHPLTPSSCLDLISSMWHGLQYSPPAQWASVAKKGRWTDLNWITIIYHQGVIWLLICKSWNLQNLHATPYEVHVGHCTATQKTKNETNKDECLDATEIIKEKQREHFSPAGPCDSRADPLICLKQ